MIPPFTSIPAFVMRYTTPRSKIITSTRDMTAVSGDVAYTGVGFKPSSIICFYCIAGGQVGGDGMADSALGSQALSRQAATGIYDIVGSYLIVLEQTAGNDQLATVKTYDSNGFTLTWTKVGDPTGTGELAFLCFR